MIKARRIGRYAGVWRLVWTDDQAVSLRLWFDEARARKAAERIRAKQQQISLDL